MLDGEQKLKPDNHKPNHHLLQAQHPFHSIANHTIQHVSGLQETAI
jgi:hypothetical protein